MARTLIWNTSATAQTLPAEYGGSTVQPGYGWIVADESSVAVTAMGGFAAMQSKWAVSAISTDEALGSIDMRAAGVALIADVVSTIGGGGGGGGGPVSWADVLGKPSFSAVATSGSYTDLSDTPVLADVASSGLYSDLSGTPSIPVASNVLSTDIAATGSAGVLNTYARGDHQHAHGTQAGGTLHSSATTASAGFMSAADKSKLDGLATVATSGEYADLNGTPSLATVATTGSYNDLEDLPAAGFSGDYADLANKPSLFSGSYTDLTDKPTLSTVASSGNYTDLTNKPSLSTVATTGSYNDLSDKPSQFSGVYADLSGKPDLSGYLTSVATANINDSAVTSAKIASVAAAKVTGLAAVATSGAYADLSGKPSLAAVATSGSATDLANQAYDFASEATGSLVVDQVVLRLIAPRNLVLQSLTQGSTTTAVVVVKVADVAAVYPQAVSAGQLITVVVTTAGIGCWFTITGKIA